MFLNANYHHPAEHDRLEAGRQEVPGLGGEGGCGCSLRESRVGYYILELKALLGPPRPSEATSSPRSPPWPRARQRPSRQHGV